MDTESQWSSTFEPIRRAYSDRYVLNAVADRIAELQDDRIPKPEWAKAKMVFVLMEVPAREMEG